MSTVGLARILDIGQSAISRSVQRGVKIAETVDFAHQFLVIMKSCPQKPEKAKNSLINVDSVELCYLVEKVNFELRSKKVGNKLSSMGIYNELILHNLPSMLRSFKVVIFLENIFLPFNRIIVELKLPEDAERKIEHTFKVKLAEQKE